MLACQHCSCFKCNLSTLLCTHTACSVYGCPDDCIGYKISSRQHLSNTARLSNRKSLHLRPLPGVMRHCHSHACLLTTAWSKFGCSIDIHTRTHAPYLTRTTAFRESSIDFNFFTLSLAWQKNLQIHACLNPKLELSWWPEPKYLTVRIVSRRDWGQPTSLALGKRYLPDYLYLMILSQSLLLAPSTTQKHILPASSFPYSIDPLYTIRK